jgi:hypothetical protein
MADSSVAITAGSGTPIRVLTGLGAGSADQQVMTLADSAGNLLGTTAAPIPVQSPNVSLAATAFTAADAVVAAPIGDGTIVSGASTAGSVVPIAVPSGVSSWLVLIKGLTAAQTTITIYFEASSNSTNGTDGDWVEIKGRRTGVAVGQEAVDYKTQQNGYYRGNDSGFTWFRGRLLGAFTGTPTFSFSTSQGTGAVFLNSGLPTSGSTIGSVNLVSSAGNIPMVTGALTAAVADNPGTATTVTTSAQVIAAVANSGNVTFHLVTTAFVGTVVFEASINGGVNYAPLMSIREDGSGAETSLILNIASAYIRTYTSGLPGFTHFRVRCSAFTSGSLAVAISQGPILIEPSPVLGAGSATVGFLANPSTGTITSPALSLTSFTVLAANALRRGATFFNDSSNVLYLALAATASTTAYTVQVIPGWAYELPGPHIYSGIVTGIALTATGSVRVTEMTP